MILAPTTSFLCWSGERSRMLHSSKDSCRISICAESVQPQIQDWPRASGRHPLGCMPAGRVHNVPRINGFQFKISCWISSVPGLTTAYLLILHIRVTVKRLLPTIQWVRIIGVAAINLTTIQRTIDEGAVEFRDFSLLFFCKGCLVQASKCWSGYVCQEIVQPRGDHLFLLRKFVYEDLQSRKSKTKLYGSSPVMQASVQCFKHYAIQLTTSEVAFNWVKASAQGKRAIYIVPLTWCIGGYINDYKYDKGNLDYKTYTDPKLYLSNERRPNVKLEKTPNPASIITYIHTYNCVTVKATTQIYKRKELYTDYSREDYGMEKVERILFSFISFFIPPLQLCFFVFLFFCLGFCSLLQYKFLPSIKTFCVHVFLSKFLCAQSWKLTCFKHVCF